MVLKKSFAVLTSLVLVLMLIISGCGQSAPQQQSQQPAAQNQQQTSNQTGDTIKIGFIAGMSGANAELGNGMKMAAEMAVEEWNAKGGIDGKKIELIERDDHYNNTDSVNAATELIDNNKVVAIVGPTGSGMVKAVMQVTAAKGIPQMITNGMDNEFTNPIVKNAFRFAMPNWVQEEQTVEFAQKHFKNPAVISDTSAYGKPGGDEIVKMLTDRGMKVATREEYKPGDVDMTAQVLRMKDAGADGVIIWGMGADAANIKKAMVANGLDVPMIGGNPLVMKSYRDIAGEAVKGTYTSYLDAFIKKPFKPEAQAFAEAWKAKYPDDNVFYGTGRDPWYYLAMPAQTYDSVNVLLTAIQNAGSTEPQKIIEALENIKDFKGVTNTITFAADDHDAQGPENNIVVEIKSDNVYPITE